MTVVGDGQQPIPFSQVTVCSGFQQAVYQTVLPEGDAFGHAGGAGGVDDVGNVTGCGGLKGDGLPIGGGDAVQIHQSDIRQTAQLGCPAAVGQDYPDPGVFQTPCKLLLRHLDIQREVGAVAHGAGKGGVQLLCAFFQEYCRLA